MSNLTHFDEAGQAVMVDVTEKGITERVAIAEGTVTMKKETLDLIKQGGMGKGDVLGVARIAGIMAAKKTSDLIPLCHPLMLTKSNVDFKIDDDNSSVKVISKVKTTGKTGVEMEALTAVSVAVLTIYDMCKAIDKRIVVSNIHLVKKTGGKSGEFNF